MEKFFIKDGVLYVQDQPLTKVTPERVDFIDNHTAYKCGYDDGYAKAIELNKLLEIKLEVAVKALKKIEYHFDDTGAYHHANDALSFIEQIDKTNLVQK